MIQRIQTVWFFLAAVVAALLFCIPASHFTVGSDSEASFTLTAIGLRGADGTYLRFAWGILTFSILETILPIVALLSYKNRKRQRLLSTCLLLGYIILLGAIITYGYAYASDLKASLNIYIGTALPVVGYILVRLALRGVQKDEELIRSTERFR